MTLIGAFWPSMVSGITHEVSSRVSRGRLQTTFDSEDDPQDVRHYIQGTTGASPSRQERWRRQKFVGGGGFGSVFLEKCVEVTGIEDDHEGKTGELKTGDLRAVKRLQKPRNQGILSSELLQELNTLLYFTDIKYEYFFVKTYGWYETASMLFIAMEYLPLGDMESYLLDHGRVSEEDTRHISQQVLRGLEYMHSSRLVHRDLKPANILIKTRPPQGIWWVKIADFGLSKIMEQSRSLSPTICGTLGFIAPELLGIRVVDRGADGLSQLDKAKAADMWAAGETIFRILTATSTFGNNMQGLFDYVQGSVPFPDSALRDAGVSEEGISFICDCMDPSPSSRPSATFAIEGTAWQKGFHNNYRGWKALTRHTLLCKGEDPPFILFAPTGDRLIVITMHKIYLWNIETARTDYTFSSHMGQCWSHGSISADGRYLCVTQAVAGRPSEILDARTLGYYIQAPNDGWTEGEVPKISTFSHDGKWLVIASGDWLCQMDVREEPYEWRIVGRHVGAILPYSGRSLTKGIKSMAFTADSKRLVAAYEEKVVIKDTSTSRWLNLQVLDYPCPLNSVSVSPGGTMVACGTSTGVIWLWTSSMDCWKRRMVPSGGPDKIGPAIENLEFSATGLSVTWTYKDTHTVSLVKTQPLNEVGASWYLYTNDCQQVGRTVTFPRRMHGATALGGQGGIGSSVDFWRYET